MCLCHLCAVRRRLKSIPAILVGQVFLLVEEASIQFDKLGLDIKPAFARMAKSVQHTRC